MNDVLLNKAAVIERCLRRVREEYAAAGVDFEKDYTRQDAVVLNLLRAAEASIDAAMHLVRVNRLGVPQQSREAFRLLADAGLLSPSSSTRLQAMVGFRNIAVHEYQKIDLQIVRSIVEERLVDFEAFAEALIAQTQ